MKRIGQAARLGWVMAIAFGLPWWAGAVTNSVPWSDSFESYANGQSLNGLNGWGVESASPSVVTNQASIVNLLTNYPLAGRSYPLPASPHAQVLRLSGVVSNSIASVSNGVVAMDLMAMPEWMTSLPGGSTAVKFSFCVASNGQLALWYRDTTANPATNAWLILTNSPVIASNAWSRFTVLQDYSNRLFQIRINEGSPLTDGKGLTVGGGGRSGPWFPMVQTNPAMAQVMASGSASYLEDLVLAKRSVGWSATNLNERSANDGVVDSSTPVMITLTSDSFAGNSGEDFVASGKVMVAGLPAGLTAVVAWQSSNSLALSLSGAAVHHEAADSTNLQLAFANTAFALGNASDVSGGQATVRLAFLDAPLLQWSGSAFVESAANDGSIDNTTPLILTLLRGTFNGAVGEDFGHNAAKLQVLNLPDGLSVQALVQSATQIVVSLTGNALQHASSSSGIVTLAFLDGAFNSVPAAAITNASAALDVVFSDPATLAYGATVFTETVVNDGSVSGAPLTLVNKTFNATQGENLVASGKVTVNNLPAGLTLQMNRGATAQQADLLFSGKATAHAASDSISTLGVVFHDSAFVGGNAAAVLNASRTDLGIQFSDPRSLSYGATGFTELYSGLIDNRNPMTISLSGDTFAGSIGSDLVAGGKVTVANLPAGLTAVMTVQSSTRLSVTLTGVAAAQASSNSLANLQFSFHDGAFAAGNSSYVGNAVKSDLTVTFLDDSGYFNVLPYREPFEEYASGLWLAGTNGWSGLYRADACVVTNSPLKSALLADYLGAHGSLPVSGTHTQLLYVSDSVETAVHSETASFVYLDFMTCPVPLQAIPQASTDMQFAFYISTNRELVLWCRSSPAADAGWVTVAGAGVVETSAWVRFTLAQDYSNNMFQIHLNGGGPVVDAAGWSTARGGTQPGSWFCMVKTNGTMSAFRMAGVGDGYLDDVTVQTEVPAGLGSGSVFLIR